jgi:predicted transposase YbfD/YdcC
VISAWATANHLVLGQRKVDEKSNEITAIPELLRLLDVSGCIVTIDAMGCQTEIAKQIIDQEADYVLTVKENQGYLYEDIDLFFQLARQNNFQKVNYTFDRTVNKGHGRIRKDNAPENMAALRRIALNLLKQEKTLKRGIQG